MSDKIADDRLIDVNGLGLAELLNDFDETCLAAALGRILAPDQGVEYHGFNSSI